MRQFTVAMPFTGVAYKTIEAETEEEAIEKFLDNTSLPIGPSDGKDDAEVEEWDFCERVVGGNVFYGVRNEVEVTEDYFLKDL